MLYRNRSHKGQATLLVTFALVPMIGLLGLVTDLGYMHYLKKSAQAAADAAVLAAVSQVHSNVGGSKFTCDMVGVTCKTSYTCPTSPTADNAADIACLYAKQNGFISKGNQSVVIDANVGTTLPANAPGVNSAAYWVTVTVSQTVPQLFSAVMGNTTGKVAAQSTAGLNPAKDCIYALDPSSIGGYYQNGNTSVTSACGVYVDSSSSSALYNSGNSTLTASEYDIVGNYQWHGSLTPTPNVGAPSSPDPLKNLAAPSPCSSSGGCAAAACKANSAPLVIDSDTTLNAGTYCGGIYVKKGTLTLSGTGTGIFILVGGGLGTQDTNSIIKGTGVFLYNTYDSKNAYQAFSLAAGSDVELSAPTSGTYAGILAMQDRTCCSTAPGSLLTESFQGGPSAKFEGTLYFPTSVIDFAGNPTVSIVHYTIVVAWQFRVLGTSTFNNDYSVLTGGSPIQQVGLIE